MIGYYGMDGRRLTLDEFGALFEGDQSQRVVARTDLPGGAWVSTVLLGIDHNFSSEGPPLIFETMVFAGPEGGAELDCRRYATREQAEAGHSELVTRWTGWTPGDPHPDGAEASFLTQFLEALGNPHPDEMVVMYSRDANPDDDDRIEL